MLTRSESWDALLLPPNLLQMPHTPTTDHLRNPSEFSTNHENQLIEQIEELEHVNKVLEDEVDGLIKSERALQKRLQQQKLEKEMANELIVNLKTEKKAAEELEMKNRKAAKKYKKKVEELNHKSGELQKEIRMYEELQTIRRQEFDILQLQQNEQNARKSVLEIDDSSSPSSTQSKIDLAGSLQAFRNQVVALEEKIKEQQKTVESREKTIKRLQNKISEFGDPEHIIRALNEELRDVKDKSSALSEDLAAGREAEELLAEQLQQCEDRLKEQIEKNLETTEMFVVKESELYETRKELKMKETKCTNGECSHAEKLENARIYTIEKLHDIKDEFATKEKEVVDLRQQLLDLEEKLETCSSATKRVKLMNSISHLHDDVMEKEMTMDVIRSRLTNFYLQSVDKNCLGCQFLEDENQRIRKQRSEFQSNIIRVKLQLAEAESELREYQAK